MPPKKKQAALKAAQIQQFAPNAGERILTWEDVLQQWYFYPDFESYLNSRNILREGILNSINSRLKSKSFIWSDESPFLLAASSYFLASFFLSDDIIGCSKEQFFDQISQHTGELSREKISRYFNDDEYRSHPFYLHLRLDTDLHQKDYVARIVPAADSVEDVYFLAHSEFAPLSEQECKELEEDPDCLDDFTSEFFSKSIFSNNDLPCKVKMFPTPVKNITQPRQPFEQASLALSALPDTQNIQAIKSDVANLPDTAFRQLILSLVADSPRKEAMYEVLHQVRLQELQAEVEQFKTVYPGDDATDEEKLPWRRDMLALREIWKRTQEGTAGEREVVQAQLRKLLRLGIKTDVGFVVNQTRPGFYYLKAHWYADTQKKDKRLKPICRCSEAGIPVSEW